MNPVFQFSNIGYNSAVTLAKYAPEYKTVNPNPGVNLKGKCSNNKCIAFNKPTWVKFGFGNFDIGKIRNKSFCPCCKQKIDPITIVTFGFTVAEIQVEGVKYQGQQEVEYKQTFVQKQGRFTYFREYDANQVQQWIYLEVTAKEIK